MWQVNSLKIISAQSTLQPRDAGTELDFPSNHYSPLPGMAVVPGPDLGAVSPVLSMLLLLGPDNEEEEAEGTEYVITYLKTIIMHTNKGAKFRLYEQP